MRGNQNKNRQHDKKRTRGAGPGLQQVDAVGVGLEGHVEVRQEGEPRRRHAARGHSNVAIRLVPFAQLQPVHLWRIRGISNRKINRKIKEKKKEKKENNCERRGEK